MGQAEGGNKGGGEVGERQRGKTDETEGNMDVNTNVNVYVVHEHTRAVTRKRK